MDEQRRGRGPDFVPDDDNVNRGASVFRQPSYRDNPLQLGDHQAGERGSRPIIKWRLYT